MNWRRGLRLLKWSAISLALLLLGLIALVSSIVATEPGSRWFLQLSSRFLPLELGDIRGNLLTGLDVSYFDYRQEDNGRLTQRYRAEQVSFRWQPFALVYSAVSVQSLQAEKLLLVLPAPGEDATEPEPTPWPSLALPVRIELGQLQLRDIQIQQQTPAGEPQPLVDFQSLSSSSLSLGTFNLRIGDLALVADDYTLIVNGRLGLRYPYDVAMDVFWQYQLGKDDNDGEPMLFSGRGSLEGDARSLGVEHQLMTPLAIRSRGQFLPNLSSPPDAIAMLASPEVRLTNDWPLQAIPAQWLPEGALVPSLEGSLVMSGWLDAYQVTLDSRVETPDWPAIQLQAQAGGDLQQLTFDSLSSRLLGTTDDSRLDLNGRVAWAPHLAWDLSLSAKNLDPARLLPEWPGQVSLQGRSEGSFADGRLQLVVEDIEGRGELRGLGLDVQGALYLNDREWRSPGLTLALGANRLGLQGQMQGQDLHLDWELAAPLLHQLDARLTGAVASRGQLRGSLDNPRVTLSASAQKLRWEELSLTELDLSLTPDERQNYQLSLALAELNAAGTRIKQFTLTGQGELSGHRLQAALDTDGLGSLSLALNSGYDQGSWRGRFTELELRLPQLPRWWLLSASEMHVTAQRADLGQLCLTTRSGNPGPAGEDAEPEADPVVPSLCTQGHWDAEKGLALTGELDNIPLRQLRSLLKPDVSLQGFIAGSFQLNMPAGQAPEAAISLTSRDAALHYQYADDPVQVFPWELTRLEGSWRNQQINAELESDWAPYGQIQARAQLDIERQQLDAKLDAQFSDLSPLGALVPQADELSGQLVADLTASGALTSPRIEGQLLLTQGAAKVPRLGLDLQDIRLALNSYPDGRLSLETGVSSGEGRIQVSSELRGLGAEDWQLIGTMEGENFQVLDQQQIKARISPALRLEASPEAVRLTGEARIPYARADIKSLPPTATQVSEDVVIEQPGETRDRMVAQDRFYMNITATLGDDVRFNGFGLTSRLEGRMTVAKTPERPLLTTGYVGVAEGKYKAYGQELTISRGQLVFQGPYDNPGLDIRAQRLLRGTSDHIVGLQIGGTLQRPTSQVYSDPPLENEGDAMGLLLTGKPLSEASAGDAYLIISAMSGLGMNEGGGVTGKIANAFSLDELTINAEDGLEQSALWLGKQITDRLYLRYVVSLFEQANKLVMTYQINDRLRLEAESGKSQSADIIYKFER